jgi:hypothetical protein
VGAPDYKTHIPDTTASRTCETTRCRVPSRKTDTPGAPVGVLKYIRRNPDTTANRTCATTPSRDPNRMQRTEVVKAEETDQKQVTADTQAENVEGG